jgi:hypothetical protein
VASDLVLANVHLFIHYLQRYPLAFCVLILPLSIARWIAFVSEYASKKSPVPSAPTIAFNALYNLTGLVDVILFLTTRRGLLLFEGGNQDVNPDGGSGPGTEVSGDWELGRLPEDRSSMASSRLA